MLEEVGSTMKEAAERAPALTRPTWICAKRQTAAYGRQGRAWANPEGNLAATLILKPKGSVQQAALRSFVAANALFAALARFVEPECLSVKWPNDVLLSGGKVAGVLLESSGSVNGVEWLSIGIGVNLRHVPLGVTQANFVPVSLAEQGVIVQADAFLQVLASEFAAEEDVMQRLGFEVIREKWLKHAARLGQVITARTMTATLTGVFETVDGQGNLVLRTQTGSQVIPAADVYF